MKTPAKVKPTARSVSRHDISDEQWNKLKPFIYLRYATPKWEAKIRRFANGVRFILRIGTPWRDLPPGHGKWNSVWRQFSRWSATAIGSGCLKACGTAKTLIWKPSCSTRP